MAEVPKDQRLFVELAKKRGFIDEKTADAALARARDGVSVKDTLSLSPGKRAALEESVAKLAFTCQRCGKRDIRSPGSSPSLDTCDECAATSQANASRQEAAPAWMTRKYSEAVKKVTAERAVPAIDESAPTKADATPVTTKSARVSAAEVLARQESATDAKTVSDDFSPGVKPPASTPDAPGGGASAVASPAGGEQIAAGQLLGGCRIGAKLGQGGMGRVYRARHLGFDRDVALKVLDERLVARQGFVEQFMSEARVLFGLDHPNVVRVFNVDKDQSGIVFLVMELLEGGSVHGLWLERGKKLPIDEAVRVVSEAALGLNHAHQKKLLHRDVKPANLMLNAEGRVKVVDFGLAVPTENELFVATAIAGTPHYMAPEQADGLKLDARCDQYSLGVTLFQLVCGRLPFEKKKPVDILFAHMTEAPPRPRDLRPDCPEWLERIILKMMAKAPADRFATLGDAGMALSEGDRGAKEPARPTDAEKKAPAKPAVRLEQILAFEKGVMPQPLPLPTWRPALAIASASVIAAGLFLAFPAREALGRSADMGRDEIPAAVRDLERDVEATVRAGTGEALAQAVARVSEAAQDLGGRPGASLLDGLRESLKKRLAKATADYAAALEKRTDDLLAKKRHGAAIEKLDPADHEIAAYGLQANAVALQKKVADALLAERGEVYVPKGFFVGADGAPVSLPGFYVDRTEVTNQAWANARAAAGLAAPASWAKGALDPALASRPVTGISYEEAEKFARSLGKRLPTSQEWTKAARGASDDRAYPWGGKFETGRANLLDGGSGALEDVGAREGDASPFGVRDMAGNALEWVAGDKSPLVAGGGFLSHALSARVVSRVPLDPKSRHAAVGFRCARDVEKD